MPEPIQRGRRYMPGLDGLRGIAVLAVIAYHLGIGWAPGGLLGVGVFFTLSGYLITDLLLSQWARGDRKLASFWIARARRLLPALFVMLAVVVAWVAIFGPAQPAEFGDAVGAAVLYVSNWQLIVQDVSYFDRFGPLSPLKHLWPLVPPRPDPRTGATALDRRALLRHLPLALPDHRPHHAGRVAGARPAA